MNILVLVRTLNEERNIQRFCEQYSWANKILVADSGSSDATKRIASSYPHVEVRDFPDKITRNTGFIDVPESKHTQFLLEWSKEYEPDWVILDDCDCWPNFDLHRDARGLITQAFNEGWIQININRLYIYKNDWYFPDLNKAGTSVWGWQPSKLHIWTDGDYSHLTFHGLLGEHFVVDFPYCLLHHSWPSNQVIQEKMERWRNRGEARGHPKEWAGRLIALPPYAYI